MIGRSPAGSRLAAILDSLNDAVRSADFARLGQISGLLETILDDAIALHPAEAKRIRLQAARNARCLEAAAEGIRAGKRRLREIEAAAEGVTYDRNGRLHRGTGANDGTNAPGLGRRL